MLIRRRFQQAVSLKDRLAFFSKQLRDKAAELHPGPERDDLLRRARIADTAAHIDAWANSPGLRPPR